MNKISQKEVGELADISAAIAQVYDDLEALADKFREEAQALFDACISPSDMYAES